MTLERGSLLNNRYRIVDVLGQGGMGSVYRAVDENLGVEVAVKENQFLTEEYARQFRREGTLLATLRHPNLPRVSDHFEVEGQGQYLVMDYIEGEDLRQRMERLGVIPEAEVVLIGAAICDALAYLHTRRPPVVHRDIKPGNVKITPEGQIVLVDFGLAKIMAESQQTTTGARAMTPGYSPPEQYGTARTDPRTDVYSLAATLYAALTGAIPEDGLARVTGSAELTPVRQLAPGVHRRLAQVIERGLAVRADDRYQTAEEMKKALLDSLSSTRRAPRELTVPPAPVSTPAAVAIFDIDSDSVPLKNNGGQVAGHVDVFTTPREQSWLNGHNLAALLLLAITFIGSAFWLTRPMGGGFSVLSAGLPTPTATSPLPTATVPPQPTALPVAGLAASPTLAPTAAPTIEPTAIPTPAPTSIGGTGELAFVSERTGRPQIYIMDAGGGSLRQITTMPDGACQPDWSPDGQRLVFISPCVGKREYYERTSLYLIDADGKNLQPLAASPEGDFDPAWSPDGTRIAYTSLRDGRPQIFIMNLADQISTLLFSDSYYADKNPAWSPSGEQIAFIRMRSSGEVWVTAADGQDVFKYTVSGNVNDLWPAWSTDGQVIYFSQAPVGNAIPWLVGLRYEDRGLSREFRIPASTPAEVGPVADLSVSPDGFWFAFESWPDGANHDIYRMTITGANVTRLTTDRENDYQPDWRPR